MGLNAVTSVPKYTDGEILEASRLNVTNSGIPVFADATARDAGFGGTGEKVLAEGQYAYLESTNATQYYDGAAWQNVGTSGLVFLTGGTFSAVTSISLPNGTFTSTYQNYRMMLQINTLTADCDFTMRLRSGGTDNTSNAYERYNILGSGGGVVSGDGGTTTSFKFYEADAGILPARYAWTIDIMGPQAAMKTTILGSLGYINKPESTIYGVHMAQNFNPDTSFDSLSFISSVASSMSGNYYVYGYAKS